MSSPESLLIKKLEQCHDLMYELNTSQTYMKLIQELLDWASETYGLIDDDDY